MKKIISLLLLVFSASILNARSIKLTYLFDKNEGTLRISKTDSKTKTQRPYVLLFNGMNLIVSQNKDTLQSISNFLNDMIGNRTIYPWNEKNVISLNDILNSIERQMIWADYQVSRYPDQFSGETFFAYYYFYKQD